MSIVLNMVGGGGGKLKDTDAVLAVTVPTGSSVSMTKGGVTLTPTIWTTNSDNTLDVAIFSVPASTFDSNAWTVTASLGTDTTSNTIVIDSAEEYEMTLSYFLWLYKDGVNNGLVQGRYSTYTQKTVTFGTNSIRLAYIQSDSSTVTCAVITQNTLDFSEYSIAHILINTTSRPTNAAFNALGLTDASPTYTNFIDRLILNNTALSIGEYEYTMDVSSYTGNYYLFWHCNATGANGNLEAFIKRIWLE